MHGRNNILRWAQARYDDGHLVFNTGFHVFTQARITRVRYLINGIGSDRFVGLLLGVFSQLVFDSL